MKTVTALLISLVAILAAGAANAQTCDFSGAAVGPSEARMKVRVRGDDGVLRTHHFGGPAHAFYYIHDIYGEEPNIHSAFILDYATGREINAMNATLLMDVNVRPAGTAADPPTVGFASREEALRWQRRIGGHTHDGFLDFWAHMDELYHESGGNMGDRRQHYGYQR